MRALQIIKPMPSDKNCYSFSIYKMIQILCEALEADLRLVEKETKSQLL